MDQDRLTARRRDIADGRYGVDPGTLAEAILATPGAVVLWGREYSYRRRPAIGRDHGQVEAQGR
jgi:hypothetical protein